MNFLAEKVSNDKIRHNFLKEIKQKEVRSCRVQTMSSRLKFIKGDLKTLK